MKCCQLISVFVQPRAVDPQYWVDWHNYWRVKQSLTGMWTACKCLASWKEIRTSQVASKNIRGVRPRPRLDNEKPRFRSPSWSTLKKSSHVEKGGWASLVVPQDGVRAKFTFVQTTYRIFLNRSRSKCWKINNSSWGFYSRKYAIRTT